MRNSQVYRTPHVVALTLAQAREWGATGANCCQFRSRVSRQLSAFKAAAFAGRFGQLVKCPRIDRRFFVQRQRHGAAETIRTCIAHGARADCEQFTADRRPDRAFGPRPARALAALPLVSKTVTGSIPAVRFAVSRFREGERKPVKPPSAPVTLESRLLFSWRPKPSSSSSIARLPHVVSSPVSGTSGAATIPPLRRPSRPSCEPWDSPRIPPRNSAARWRQRRAASGADCCRRPLWPANPTAWNSPSTCPPNPWENAPAFRSSGRTAAPRLSTDRKSTSL